MLPKSILLHQTFVPRSRAKIKTMEWTGLREQCPISNPIRSALEVPAPLSECLMGTWRAGPQHLLHVLLCESCHWNFGSRSTSLSNHMLSRDITAGRFFWGTSKLMAILCSFQSTLSQFQASETPSQEEATCLQLLALTATRWPWWDRQLPSHVPSKPASVC